jgi:16S rRNA (guanine966-N2)-methyltransferase
MRIIAGTVGGQRLSAPRGAATRPTAERVREAIFSILLSRGEPPERVLDLYAGSGALGLEALSRGAARCVFVDESEEACELVRRNAASLGFAARTRVDRTRVLSWLRRPHTERFGWIFLDPPYASGDTGELGKALDKLAPTELLAPGGAVIAEHDWRRAPKAPPAPLTLLDCRRYGQTAISLFGLADSTTSPTEPA